MEKVLFFVGNFPEPQAAHVQSLPTQNKIIPKIVEAEGLFGSDRILSGHKHLFQKKTPEWEELTNKVLLHNYIFLME